MAVADERAVQEVLRAERDLYRAMEAHDIEALRRMLAPDVVYVHSTAVSESREAYLAGVADGLYDYESVASRDVRVRVYGNVALVDGVCDMRVGERGKPRDLIRLMFALAWVRTDDGWTLVHRHAVRIPHG